METNQTEPQPQPEMSAEESEKAAQRILNKFRRLDRERKDWKKLAKSMYVVLDRMHKPRQKKLLEKYLKTKHKYRKSW